MRFPEELYRYLKEHDLIGVKGGTDPHDFLDIWMVEVDGRVFARTWAKSRRSWYTAFLDTGVGEIKYGDTVIAVTGRLLDADPELTRRINDAYLTRFDQEENRPYAIGITQPEYFDYTMEFFYDA
jgi:hypothetical protein